MGDHEAEVSKFYHDLKFEIETGKMDMKAGVIGEIVIGPRCPVSVYSCLIEAAIQVSQEFEGNIPIVINLENDFSLLKWVIDQFKSGGMDSEKIVIKVSDYYDPNSEEIMPHIHEILSNTKFSIMLSFHSRGADKNNKINNAHNLIKFVSKLEKAQLDRFLITSNCSFKHHLTQYGGDGFNIAFDAIKNFESEILTQLTSTNPARIFKWWTEPPVEEEEVEIWECYICKV